MSSPAGENTPSIVEVHLERYLMRTGKGTRMHGGAGRGRTAPQEHGLFHTGRKAGAACPRRL